MKVAYVGNFQPEYSTENDVRRAFEHLGWEVVRVQENRESPAFLQHAALTSDLLLWTCTWDDAQPLDQSIDTLRRCAMAGIPTATLHLDTFWPVSRGGRKWWMSPMFFTRYVFTADGDWPDKWEQLGVDHHWLPPAVRHDAVKLGEYRPEYACDVAFVGSDGVGYHPDVWSYRKELVERLRRMCAENGWTYRNPGGADPKVERDDRMNDFYASAKITVGDSLCVQREASLYCSDRVFEAPGRGGFLIMPAINWLMDLYGDAMAFYGWDDWAELETTIRSYLARDDDRHAMRAEAHKIVADGHTYVHRVETLVRTIWGTEGP